MVIERHMLPSDSVILAWHELDECISHKSDKPLPFLEQQRDVYARVQRSRHCVMGTAPLSEIGLWKVGTANSCSSYHFKQNAISLSG